YPGIAVADEVRAAGGEVMFVGTTRGIEARVVPAAGDPLELFEVSGLKRMGLIRTLQGLGRVPLALAKSLSIVRRFKPDVVLGVGGYASGPMVLAAAPAPAPPARHTRDDPPPPPPPPPRAPLRARLLPPRRPPPPLLPRGQG